MDKASLNSLLRRAKRGNGGAKMITAQELLDLNELAAKHGLLVDGVEPYRVEEKFDIPHVELTITATPFHEMYAALDWQERIAAMKDILTDLLFQTIKIGGEFRFTAWVSEEADWIP
jgi:hypothetical protein